MELKCARIRHRKSSAHMGRVIGKSEAAWTKRERGELRVSLDEVALISKELDLDEREFCTIFFDGQLPFRRKYYAFSDVAIMTEGSDKINAQKSDESVG